MDKIALVDADIMIFKYACVNEVDYDWGEGVTSKASDVDEATKGIERFIKRLETRLGVKGFKFAFTSSPNFRYSVLPTYKSNRKDEDKPDMLHKLREYVEKEYETIVKPRLEADDVMGVLATLSPNKYIICTVDKDLKQIPNIHYNWMHDEVFKVTPEEGKRYFYKQILTGDSTDGYGGCPYIGEKRSEKIFNNMEEDESYWDVVLEAYKNKDLDEEYALQQARVARILQKEDWNFEMDAVILWTPPNWKED